ncbi:uncharacterized protein LOC110442446 isoform X2 [Mizuhopecten yessoensis]|uniref:uncharacterized protein LOC110442446 isoform X2 n=1 Tax=Mizuhopecten yessoensis TaxID=6573 RepID=UPI000B45D26A|nr:uncharacterized protein LOC110442446 isoform X2 [Mizuhopecten yessoensis]
MNQMILNTLKRLVCRPHTYSMRRKQKPQRVRAEKKKYRQYSPAAISNAYKAVKNGEINVNQASIKYKVPEATLRHRLSGAVINPECTGSGPPPLMSESEEKIFVDHICMLSKVGFEYIRAEVVRIASQYAVHLGVRDDEKPLSMKWFYKLKSRWPDLPTLGKVRTLPILQAKAASPQIVSSYYLLLEGIMKKYKLHDKPQCIYSINEKSLINDNNSVHSGNSTKGVAGPVDLSSSTVTMISCGNVKGTQIPPYFVFPGKRMKKELLIGCSAGTNGEVTETGDMDTQLFQSYIENHFLKYAEECRASGQYILMLYDGFRSHISLSVIEWAKVHNILLFVLPLHMSHVLQPENDSCFGPFLEMYESECQKHLQSNSGASLITRNSIGEMACRAYTSALSPANLKSGFKRTGIYPLNQDIMQGIAKQNSSGNGKTKRGASVKGKAVPVKKIKLSLAVHVEEPDISDQESEIGMSSEEELLSSSEEEADYDDTDNKIIDVNIHHLTEETEECVVPPQDVALDLLSPHLLGACETVVSTMSEHDTPVTTSDEYVPGTHSMAFITVPTMDVAKTLSHGLVQEKLAACVNIIPSVTSVYEWEGKVNEDPELLMGESSV